MLSLIWSMTVAPNSDSPLLEPVSKVSCVVYPFMHGGNIPTNPPRVAMRQSYWMCLNILDVGYDLSPFKKKTQRKNKIDRVYRFRLIQYSKMSTQNAIILMPTTTTTAATPPRILHLPPFVTEFVFAVAEVVEAPATPPPPPTPP